MSSEKEILVDYLKKTLGKTEEEVQQLLYEKAEGSDELTLKSDSIDTLTSLDAKRVSSLKEASENEFKEKLDKIVKDQHGKVKKETLEELETALKDKFGIDAKDKKGLDLIESIIAANTKTTIDLDDVRKHPAYRELEGKIGTEYVPKADYDGLQKEYDGYKQTLSMREKLDLLRKRARVIIDECKPNLPKDAAKANRQIEVFMKTYVDSVNADISNPNDIILLDSEGKRMDDQHGNAISFRSYIEQETKSTFELLVSDAGGGAGNKTPSGGGSAQVKVPESLSDFNDIRATLSGEDLFEFHNKYCEAYNLPPIKYNKKTE